MNQELLDKIPWPAADTNKYRRGKLILVAGSARYPGAAVLAALASQRMGAGYTEVVTVPRAVDVVRIASPSLVVRSSDDWGASEIPASVEGKPCAVCVGPGFSADDENASDMVVRVLRKAACPALVDGGGLAKLASKKGLRALSERAQDGRATVITPHAGEAARLAQSLGIKVSDSEHQVRALALATQTIVVLKGPDTLISDGKNVERMTEGTPALAKAGTGDVLAGMIAALMAQGVAPIDAALLGTTLHARAGVVAANSLTDIAVKAEDVIDALPAVLKELL